MIDHLPTAEGLNTTALKLYFRAWSELVGIMSAFDEYYSTERFGRGEDDIRDEYLRASREDLQAILAAVQQSNELALKARIVEVSPYLLLLNSDISFSNAPKQVEFSTLRTLDAVDLPKAVNTLCNAPLSDSYIQLYGKLRVLRNQYTHLGDTRRVLDPLKIMNDMIDQYIELWPARFWLKDRTELASISRNGFFDGKHSSTRLYVMSQFAYERALFPPSRFRKLFGVKKSAVRLACHSCRNDWYIEHGGVPAERCLTACYDGERQRVHCLMCKEDFAVSGEQCSAANCKSEFVAPRDAASGRGLCFACGLGPDAIH